MTDTKIMESAIFANGCFWCTEAIFKRLRGVASVTPGYTGGNMKNPTYEDVSSESTGHAESIQIKFDPTIISYHTLLDVFWATHDPTTINQQGNDVGTQYRSEIFYQNDGQKKIAEESKKKLEQSGTYHSPIVTKIEPFTKFYEAEEYHKDYYDSNRFAPYCMVVINPKIQKLMKHFKDEIKKEYK
ncbi:MAG TPA: peptide-methionine (S)-S-oxide reductase MsrA [Candidatus Sulfotelmatobacter sp.]|jgi:peptide-methionine (S)-S-oxide reductase|nr:peptide-methionine (S)-S-oxide reductase MsrA [Candidatus Sulfotelmatobacter sp.]